MFGNTFEFILSIIAPNLEKYPGLEMIFPEKQFLICIWKIVQILRGTLVNLASIFIKWPVGDNVQEVWTSFEAITIDGIHVNIPSPRVNPEAYVNRKSYFSIQLQFLLSIYISYSISYREFVIILRFTHCYIGHVGSVHDQRVFRLSEIQDALGNPEKFPDECHLIDDAYKLHDNLMIFYRDNDHLTERQKITITANPQRELLLKECLVF
ncbi:hypothetical protein P5V15_005911 [Pogonomyrmex californicus]